MKRIILTIAAVLTLISCSPEEAISSQPTTKIVGKWVITKRPADIPGWGEGTSIPCGGLETITFRIDNTTETIFHYRFSTGECKYSDFYHDYSFLEVTTETGSVNYWRETYTVQFIEDTMLWTRNGYLLYELERFNN